MLDRLVGLLVLTAFAPALGLLGLVVGVLCPGPIFESRLRIEDGTLYRTRRFRTDDCRFSAFLRRYELDNLPALLDMAAGRARLRCERSSGPNGASQIRIVIRAPRPKMTSHPTAASASHINRIIE